MTARQPYHLNPPRLGDTVFLGSNSSNSMIVTGWHQIEEANIVVGHIIICSWFDDQKHLQSAQFNSRCLNMKVITE